LIDSHSPPSGRLLRSFKRARGDSEFTVSSVVEIATEERTALSPAASQSKTHEVDLEVTDEAKGAFLV
jgi:hypothetical protein